MPWTMRTALRAIQSSVDGETLARALFDPELYRAASRVLRGASREETHGPFVVTEDGGELTVEARVVDPVYQAAAWELTAAIREAVLSAQEGGEGYASMSVRPLRFRLGTGQVVVNLRYDPELKAVEAYRVRMYVELVRGHDWGDPA